MSRSKLVVVVAVTAALAGCPKDKAPETKSETPVTKPGEKKPDEKKPEAKAEVPAPTGPVAKVDNPGLAYFGVDGTGLVRLEDGKLTVVPGIDSMIRAIVPSKDALYVSSTSGIFRIKGTEAPQKIGDFSKPGSADHMAVGPDGDLWTISFKGVGHYNGKEWTIEEKTKLDPAITLLRDIAVDAQGRVLVSSPDKIFMREKDAWKALDPGALVAKKPWFEDLEATPDKSVYVAHLGGLLKYAGDSWSKVAGVTSKPHAMAVAPDGRLLLVGMLQRISILSPDGKEQKLTPQSAGFKAKQIRKAAADAAGRFWLSTDHGMVILGKDGKAVQQWEPGTVKEVSGQVQAMAMIGNGPNLPQLGAKIVGTVKGKVLRGGSGVANSAIQICESPSMFFRGSPCAGAIFFKEAQTDAEGNFKLPAVPVGTYRFAIKAGGKWVITLGGDCCAKMKEGQEYDVGSITLRER